MSVGAILDLLVKIPAAVLAVEAFAADITNWWIQRQNSQTLAAIADAAALAARANTDELRYQAAQAWRAALSKPRVSAN